MMKKLILVAVVAALAGGQATAHAAPVEPNGSAHAVPSGPAGRATAAVPPGYSVTGLDVSNHQGTINWANVAAQGAKFSYAKATESTTFTDRYFNANNAGAKANGLYAGAYHFALPDRSSGRAQADYFLDRAQFVNDGRTLPPMLDIEWPWSGSGSPSPCYGLSPSQMVNWIRAFLDRVKERTGRMAMIYTNTNWWNPCTGSNTSFGAYPLFIANYTSSPSPLPAGWSTFAMWQYADSGPLPGDQDVFNGNLAGLARLAGGGRAMVPPVSTADFTGDGKADIGAQYTNGLIRVTASTGDLSADSRLFNGPFPLVGEGWNSSNVERILTGDFNGDGKADIAAQYTNGYIRAWAGTGNLSGDSRLFTGAGVLVGEGWNSGNVERILTADFTGDGKTDIGAQYTNGLIRVAASTGDLSADSRLFSGPFPLVGEGWNSGNVERILLADFTGDGKADIGAQYTNGLIRVTASTGDLSADGRLFSGPFPLVGEGWNSGNVERILTGDFNGDGKADIGAQYTNGYIRAWAGTGNLSGDSRLFTGAGVLVGEGWNSGNVERILLADFTGDGKTDIGAQYTNGLIRVAASTGNLTTDAQLFNGPFPLVGEGWNSSNVQRII